MTSRLSRRAAFVVPALLALSLPVVGTALAATPSPQTVTVPTTGYVSINWTGTIPVTGGVTGVGTSSCESSDSTLADVETINLSVPAGLYDASTTAADFSISWDPNSGNDEVISVVKPDGTTSSADTSNTTETVSLSNPAAGSYAVRACGFAQTSAQDYTGTLRLRTTVKTAGTGPGGGGTPTSEVPATVAGAPTYANYPAPAGEADGAGEPSIGNNHQSDTTLFQSNLDTYTVGFGSETLANGATGTSTWTNKKAPLSTDSLDPILDTDPVTGRTFVSQLLAACSQSFYTDNDGGSYTPSQGCGAGTAFDHQTVGHAPYADQGATTPLHPTYPHAVYYCAQYAASANCARSDNGGLTFGAGVPIYNVPGVNNNSPLDCAGLHGHLRGAPDGSVYVPNFDCGGKVAASVSQDNGTTWNVRPVSQSTTQDESDPSISAGSGGTLYMGWEQGDTNATGSKPFVGVSRDHGQTWTNVQDVGTRFGISNIQFPEVIAGDDDRAAFAFIGTPTAGNDQQGGEASSVPASAVFGGIWHMYIATTYDGGVTWQTVDATPTDPVQRGCVWLSGGSSSCRNLLDFNDITIDKTGRIEVGWADGCIGACVGTPLTGDQVYDDPAHDANYRANHGTVTRQLTGKTLFAKFDGTLPADSTGATPGNEVPEAPLAALLPLAALVLGGAVFVLRRRTATG